MIALAFEETDGGTSTPRGRTGSATRPGSFRGAGEIADEDVPPADLAAVGLQLDRALLRHRHGPVVVVFHPGVVDDLLVVERHRHLVAAHHDPEAVPLAERLVGFDERILAGSAGGIVPQPPRALREAEVLRVGET
jgi:hypothetical protein